MRANDVMVGFLLGMIIGIIILSFIIILAFYVVGSSFHINSIIMNVTIPLNETKVIEAINQTRGN